MDGARTSCEAHRTGISYQAYIFIIHAPVHAAALGFDEWQRKIKQEQIFVDGIRAQCEAHRTGIYYQALPKTAGELPASKILAKALPWSPGQPLPKGQQAGA